MNNQRSDKTNLFNRILERIGWLQIVVSFVGIAVVAALVIYTFFPMLAVAGICLLLVIVGLISGITFANRVQRKKGSINFISNLTATPELSNEPAGPLASEPSKVIPN